MRAMLGFIGAIVLMAASGIIGVISLIASIVLITAAIVIIVAGPIIAILTIIIVILGVKDAVFGGSETKPKEEFQQERNKVEDLDNVQTPLSTGPSLSVEEQDKILADSNLLRAENASDSKPFPFFKLPRELRDDIYARFTQVRCNNLCSEKGLNYFPSGATYVGASKNMVFVSKQFKQEYEEQVARHPDNHTRTIEIVNDCDMATEWVKYRPSPTRMARLHKDWSGVARLRLVFEPDWQDGVATLTHARDELKLLLNYLPSMKSVEVEFNDLFDDVDLSTLRGYMEMACIFLLRNDDGKMIGDFLLECSATLAGARYSTSAEILLQSCPGFRDLVPEEYQDYVAECFSRGHVANTTDCYAKISNQPNAVHGLSLELRDTTFVADFEGVQAEMMTRLEGFRDSKDWRYEFWETWCELNGQLSKGREYSVQELVDPVKPLWPSMPAHHWI